MNKVEFSDIVSFDNKAILDAFKEIIAAYDEMIKFAKKSASELAASANATGANSDANKQKLEAMLEEMKVLQAQTKSYQKTLESLEAQNKKLQEQNDEKAKAEKAEIDRLKAIEDLSKQRSKAYKKEFDDKKKLADKAKEEAEIMGKQAKSIAELAKQTAILARQRREMDMASDPKRFKELTAAIDANNKKLKEFDAQIGNYQRNVGNYSSALQGFSRNLLAMAGVGSIAAIMQNATETIIEFDKQIKTLRSLNLELPIGEFKQLEEEAKRLGASTEYTSAKVAELMIEYSKAGFSKNEILQVTEATLDLATATGTDLARASEVAAANLRAFQKPASEMKNMIDIMGAAFNKSALGLEDWAYATKYVAPVAKAAGISFEEMAAMLSVLANAGIKGETAGTSLRRIITEIGASGLKTSDAIKKLAKEGLNLAAADDEVGKTAMTQLLILGKSTEQVDLLTKAYENSEGAMGKTADMMRTSLKNQIEATKSAWEGFVLSLDQKGVISNILSEIAAEFTNTFTYLRGLQEGKIGIWEFLFGDNAEVAKKVNAAKAQIRLSDKQIQEFEQRRAKIAVSAAQMSGDAQKIELARIKSINDQISNEYKLRAQEAIDLKAAKDKADADALTESNAKNKAQAEAAAKAKKEREKEQDAAFKKEIDILKKQSGVMADGRAKDLENLRINFIEQTREWEKLGIDTTNLEKWYNEEQLRINTEYNDKQHEEFLKFKEQQAKDNYDADLKYFKSKQDLEQTEFNRVKRTKEEKADFELKQQIALYEEQLRLAEKYPKLISDVEIEGIKKALADAKDSLSDSESQGFDLFALLGFTDSKDGKLEKMKQMFADTVNAVTSFFNQMADARVEAANRAVEASKTEVDNAQSYFDEQQRLKEQGLASDADTAANRLQIAKETQAKALAEQEKAQKKKAQIESISQTISLISAVANIWKTATEMGPIGFVLAGIQTAAMFGSFLLAKKTAKDSTKVEYSEGGTFDIGGGTHKSGNDTLIATTGGVQRRAERNEKVGILNPRAARKYGRNFEQFVTLANADMLSLAMTGSVGTSQSSKDYTNLLSEQNGHLSSIAKKNGTRIETFVSGGYHYTQVFKDGYKTRTEKVKLN